MKACLNMLGTHGVHCSTLLTLANQSADLFTIKWVGVGHQKAAVIFHRSSPRWVLNSASREKSGIDSSSYRDRKVAYNVHVQPWDNGPLEGQTRELRWSQITPILFWRKGGGCYTTLLIDLLKIVKWDLFSRGRWMWILAVMPYSKYLSSSRISWDSYWAGRVRRK